MAEGINDSGEVVGGAYNKNDQAFLAFLWKDGVMTNLGTLNGNGDDCSLAFHINSKGQIVGLSYPCATGPDGANVHGFLWEDGFMTDLNAFAPPSSGLTLGDGAFINDRGEIAGTGVLPDGDIHAFLLVPCDEHHPDVKDCDYDEVEATTESPVPSAQIAPASAAANAAKLSPSETMTRFRSLGAGRDRRFETVPPK